MGESRGGEGGSRRRPTQDLAALIAAQVIKSDVDVGLAGLQRVTDGTYMVLIQEHGANHSDEYLIEEDGSSHLISGSPPSGGASGEGSA